MGDPQGRGQWNSQNLRGPGEEEEVVGLRCDGCEHGSTQDSLLSRRVSDAASSVMHSGYRNQTFVVPDTASQEGSLPLTVSTPKPHVSLWLPPNPTSARPVTPIPLLVSKQHSQVHGLGCFKYRKTGLYREG